MLPLVVGAATLGVIWWRNSRPPVTAAPPFAAVVGFRRRQKSFLGRDHDAGEPPFVEVRGRRVTLSEDSRPTGPGDAEMWLDLATELRRPTAGLDLTAWLAQHPAVSQRLDAAGPSCRWEIRGASAVCHWDDPRALDWTSDRLKVCVEALVDLAESLDAR